MYIPGVTSAMAKRSNQSNNTILIKQHLHDCIQGWVVKIIKKNIIHYKQIVLVLVYVINYNSAIASLLKSFKHILLVWIFPKLENIHSIDADEVGHDSWLTANPKKSIGTP